MKKQALNPSKNAHSKPYHSDHTDAASLHLQGASGLLFIMQSSLEPSSDGELPERKYAALAHTIITLINHAHECLVDDQADFGNDWANILLTLEGTQAALDALTSGYDGQCDLPVNLIQVATLHSLRHLTDEAVAYIDAYSSDKGAA